MAIKYHLNLETASAVAVGSIFGSLGVFANAMGHIDDIRKISGGELLFSLFFVSGAACPGLLTIWSFSPQMLASCSTVLLVILSVGITLPIVSINTVFTYYAVFQSHLDKKFGEIAPMCIAVASCAIMLVMGLSVLAAFMFSLSLRDCFKIQKRLSFRSAFDWIGSPKSARKMK